MVGANNYYYVHNAHGDITQRVMANGNSTPAYTYDAFGNQREINDNDINPFRYCGEYYEKETEEIYLRNRYYDSKTSRFNSEDPIGSGNNWYAYCGNNPLTFVDPSGLVPINMDGGASKRGEKEDKFKGSSPNDSKNHNLHEKEKKENNHSITNNTHGLTSAEEKLIYDYITNPGNAIGILVSGFTGFNNAVVMSGIKYFTSYAAYAARPNNIGAGLWDKYVMKSFDDYYNWGVKSTKVLNWLAYLAVVVDVGVGIHDNIQMGAPLEKIVGDAAGDALVTGGTIWLAGKAGAAIGSLFGTSVLGVGNVVGAVAGFIVGVFIYVAVDVFQKNGKTFRERVKETFTNTISWFIEITKQGVIRAC